MLGPETLIVIGAILAIGIVLGPLVVRSTSRIDDAIAQAVDRRADSTPIGTLTR